MVVGSKVPGGGPPPPPSVLPPPPHTFHIPSPPQPPLSEGAPDAGIAALMDAIRASGGAGKLEHTQSRKIKPVEKKLEFSGNLMDYLAAKLTMKRKCISSGKQNQGAGSEDSIKGTGGSSAWDRLSAMIPPPPVPSGQTCADDADAWG